MVIGIKFCGGCNPVFDRGRRVERFRREHPEHTYVGAEGNPLCDVWMVVCGCSRRCADVRALQARKTVAVLCNEEDFLRLGQELAGMDSDAAKSETRRVLHPHDTATVSRVITEKDVETFLDLTGDANDLHVDRERAQALGFAAPPVPGMLLDSLISAVMGTTLPGRGTVYVEHTTRFLRPVFCGDSVVVTVELTNYEEEADSYLADFRVSCKSPGGERMLTAWCRQKMSKKIFRITEP